MPKVLRYFGRNEGLARDRYPTFGPKNLKMKRFLISLNFYMICIILLQSCCKDDSYTYLTDEAKEFLFYEQGDTFRLKNLMTDEIITLTVSTKSYNIYKSSGTSGGTYSGFNSDNYYEYGEYNFTNDLNCYNGNIAVEARNNGNFKLTATIGECFGNIFDTFAYQDETLTSVEVNGINYTNIYLIKSYSQTIFYSKQKGIIKITNNFSLETEFIIYE